MNEGIMDIPYAPVLTMKRCRVYDNTKKAYGEYTVIGACDNETVSSNRGVGSTTEIERTDFVIDMSKIYKNTKLINAHGALSLNIPDGTVLNGNKRGIGAIDLQQKRTTNTQVASGNYGFVVGGSSTASGINSVAMGYNNTASGNNSVAISTGNIASGANSVAMGTSNTASGTNSVAMGYNNTASGVYSVAFGYGHAISAQNSVAFGASGFINTIGKFVFGIDKEGRTGGFQTGIFDCAGITVDATTNYVLTSNNYTATSTNQLILQNNNSVFVYGYVVGQVSATSSICFEIKALVRRGANASIMSLVGTPTVTKLFNDAALAACACSVAVDTTYGAFAVRVTGIAATSIDWNCTLITSEVL